MKPKSSWISGGAFMLLAWSNAHAVELYNTPKTDIPEEYYTEPHRAEYVDQWHVISRHMASQPIVYQSPKVIDTTLRKQSYNVVPGGGPHIHHGITISNQRLTDKPSPWSGGRSLFIHARVAVPHYQGPGIVQTAIHVNIKNRDRDQVMRYVFKFYDSRSLAENTPQARVGSDGRPFISSPFNDMGRYGTRLMGYYRTRAWTQPMWVKVEITAQQLNNAIADLGIESDPPEDWFVSNLFTSQEAAAAKPKYADDFSTSRFVSKYVKAWTE